MADSAPKHPTALRTQLLGRYELVAPIAQGGMGTVWLGRLSGPYGFNRLFAIKTIVAHAAGDDGFREMFLDEALLASQVHHPNVAQIIELGESDGLLYAVMELIAGPNLSLLLRHCRERAKPPPLGVVLRVAIDAAAGLHAAHTATKADGSPLGIVHRDVSPHNILVAGDGITKVIDFGIATALERRAVTGTRSIKGKVRYMAPEQASGQAIDMRVDVFSLGAVLYTALKGHPPYHAPNEVAALARLVRGDAVEELSDSVPPGVRSAVRAALANDPNERPQSMAELSARLERAGRGIVASTREVGAWVSDMGQEALARHAERVRLASTQEPPAARSAASAEPRIASGSHPGTASGSHPGVMSGSHAGMTSGERRAINAGAASLDEIATTITPMTRAHPRPNDLPSSPDPVAWEPPAHSAFANTGTLTGAAPTPSRSWWPMVVGIALVLAAATGVVGWRMGHADAPAETSPQMRGGTRATPAAELAPAIQPPRAAEPSDATGQIAQPSPSTEGGAASSAQSAPAKTPGRRPATRHERPLSPATPTSDVDDGF